MPQAHPKTRRRATILMASAIGTALAPWVCALPAAAAPSPPTLPAPPSPRVAAPEATPSPTPASCKTIRYEAAAAADALRVTSVSPAAFGVRAATLRDVGAGQARATLATKPVASTATAGALQTGGAVARQAAPPTASSVAHAAGAAADLGTLRLGAGQLQASAHWHDGYRCGAYLGEASGSTATIGGATVLPGSSGRSLLHVTGILTGATTTGLLKHNGHTASAAGASANLTGLRLFDGTAGAATVQVLRAPSLNVVASGVKATSTVRYGAPVVTVTTTAGTRRLATPGDSADLPVPAALFGSSGAVLHLSLGTVSSRITATEVHASAVSLRVLVTSAAHATVLDLALGALDVTADAAKDAATSSGGGYGSGSGSDPSPTPSDTLSPTGAPSSLGRGSGSEGPSPSDSTPGLGGGSGSSLGSGSGGGELPVTGPNLGWFLAGGGLLAGTGYVLMLVARRRQAGG